MIIKKFVTVLIALYCLNTSLFAETVTFSSTQKPVQGTVTGITKTGFKFVTDRLYFYKFQDIRDITLDAGLQGDALKKQKNTVARISKLLDKDKYLIGVLQTKILLALEQQNYSLLEKEAQRMNRLQARWPSGRWEIHSFYEAFESDISSRDVSAFNKRLEQINLWLEAKPNSHAAKISAMSVMTGLAWAYRGMGYSNTVSEKGRNQFKHTLNEVINIGQQLRQEKSTDLMLYDYLIIAANAYGADKSTLKQLAQESSQLNPHFYLPYIRALNGILPKWGGEIGEVEKFSQWVNQLSEKENMLAVTFSVHRNVKARIIDKRYLNMDFDWNAIQKGFEDYRQKYHFNEKDLHLMAKMAVLHGDRKAAQKYFKETENTWNYLSKEVWGEEVKLERFKTWSQSKKNPKYEEVLLAIKDGFGIFSALFDTSRYTHEIFFVKDIFGNTLLHNIADSNALDYLDLISSLGININNYNDEGDTPLHIAITSGRFSNAKILIDNGADVFLPTKDRVDPTIHIAARYGQKKIVEYLLTKHPALIATEGYKNTLALHVAAKNGYIDIVELLVNHSKKHINAQDWYRYTPLHYAVRRGHFEIVQFLVENQADLTLKNKRGHTALSLAKDKGFKKIAQYLSAKGAPDSVVIDTSISWKKAKAIYEQAAQYYDAKNYLKAKNIYLKVLKQEPTYYYAYSALAQLAFHFEHDYKQADQYIDQSIAIQPSYAENYYWKGRINYSLDNPSVYRPLFQKYIKMAPNTYNTNDLKNNWSHLLVDSNSFKAKSYETFIKVSSINQQYSNYIITALVVLLLLLFIIRRKSKS